MTWLEGGVWKQEYDRLQDPKRELGPIELNLEESLVLMVNEFFIESLLGTIE